ncbi:hypothetical protein CSC2_22840 [Clostridium zeae]|uniref:Holin n=1 Tax=Clostridium zeae TaxID=2759022 RepID=A0ABQ1EB67_9CLOT|nr:hypothetical protein [Clostridium zeae]GFZ31758.1 hypothetical protein CSC2_22840 [Clostridium zeae]
MFKKVKKLKKIWETQCLAMRFLTVIGFIAFIHTCITIFINGGFSSSSNETIRSVMSSIFGYIFGDQIIPNNNLRNKKFQVLIAGFMSLLSLVVIMLSYWTSIDQTSSTIGEIRNILFSTVGFLISRVRLGTASDENANNKNGKDKFKCD